MAKNPNISLSFQASAFQTEIKKMSDSLKTVKKEFEVSNLAIQANGNALDLAANKIAGYGKQAVQQRAITNKVREAIEQATKAHADSGSRVDAARQAYDKAAKSKNTSAEELKKLKKELDNANNTYERLGKTVQTWYNKLLDSQKAENQLKVAVKQVNTEIDNQNKTLQQSAKDMRNVTTNTGNLLNVYTLLKGLAIGYAGKTLFNALIGSNAQFEQSITSFEVLLGGIDKAEKRMGELTKFAAKTPFNLPQLVDAEKRLLAYGVAAKDTAKVLPMLGDISMGNAEKLNMVSLAYGQVVTNQRLYGTELRQFAENGVPLLAELAKMYGVTEAEMRKMVEDGMIGAPAVTAALESMTSAGGKFFGMMDKQSQTMTGMWSTMQDNFGIFSREVGENSFKYLKNQLSDITDEIDRMSQSGELGDIAAEWGKGIADFVTFSAEAIMTLWDMKEALLAAGAGILAFKTTMAISGTVMAVANSIEAYTTAVKAGTTATAAFTTVMKINPWVLIASAVATVITALVAYNALTDDTITKTDELAEKTAELTEEYNRNIKAVDKQTNGQLGEVEIASRLAKELGTLSSKVNKTTEDKTRMAGIVDQLNSKIPTLALAINSETGELNKQMGVINDTIYAYKQLLFVKASEKKASAAAESIIDLQDQKKAVEKQIEVYKDFEKKYKEYKMNIGLRSFLPNNKQPKAEFPKISQEELDEYNSLAKQYNDINKAISAAETEIANSFKMSEDYTKKFGPPEIDPPGTPPPLGGDDYKNTKAQYEAGLLSASQYKKKLQSILSKTKVNTEDYYEILKEIKNIGEKASSAAEKAKSEAAKKAFDNLKYFREADMISEEEYYKSLKTLRDKYFKEGSTEWQQYTLELKGHEEELFNERRANSDQWISDQKYYGKLSSSEEIAAYDRIRKYVKEYYKSGVIDLEEYKKQMRELDKNEFEVRKNLIEQAISKEIEAEKAGLDVRKEALANEEKSIKDSYDKRKQAIEDYYDDIDRKEKQQDRQKKLSELLADEAKYQNAATKDGKERLKRIRDEISGINKEIDKEVREVEKKKKLSEAEAERDRLEEDRMKRIVALNEEYKNLDTAQKTMLSKISEYATVSAGAIDAVTKKIQAMVQALTNVKVPTKSGTNTSGTLGSNTVVNVTDNGAKYINSKSEAVDYTKELFNAAEDAIRIWGGKV